MRYRLDLDGFTRKEGEGISFKGHKLDKALRRLILSLIINNGTKGETLFCMSNFCSMLAILLCSNWHFNTSASLVIALICDDLLPGTECH